MTTFRSLNPAEGPVRSFEWMPLPTTTRHGLRSNPLSGYVVITMKGLQFLEARYNADHIPAKLVYLY